MERENLNSAFIKTLFLNLFTNKMQIIEEKIVYIVQNIFCKNVNAIRYSAKERKRKMKKIIKRIGIALVIVTCATGIFFCMIGTVPDFGVRRYVYLIFSVIFAIMVPGLLFWFLNYTEYLEDKIDMLINKESYDMIKEE